MPNAPTDRPGAPKRPLAFTLIELVAVIVVLALLAGVATSRYFNMRDGAARSSELATVGAVRSAISQQRLNNTLAGSQSGPATLDSAPAGAAAAPAGPFFTAVLSTGITDGWTKGADANTYIGPAGNTYTYDPATGRFGDAAASAPNGGVASSPPPPPSLSLTTASVWNTRSVALTPGVIVGSGYTLSGTELQLADSSPAFTESARRVAIMGQSIAAGIFSIDLETELTDYNTQLNYWQVYAVSSSAQLSLSGNTLNWGTAPAGAKLLAQNYAPIQKSDGTWYAYSDTFTVSAADAAQYDTIIVAMAGSRFANQTLGWRNVKFTAK